MSDSDPTYEEHEPSIAINPGNISERVSAYIQGSALGVLRVGVSRSNDGGVTWQYTGNSFGPELPTTTKAVDPVLAAALKNELSAPGIPPAVYFYLVYLDGRGDLPTQDSQILFRRSGDGGQTWTNPVVVAQDVSNNTLSLDKPWIAVDDLDSPPPLGRERPLYISYTAFNDPNADGFDCDVNETYPIMLVGSTDGGTTFNLGPTEVSDVSAPGRRANHGSAIAVGRHLHAGQDFRDVYVAYTQMGCSVAPEIRVTRVGMTGSAFNVIERSTVASYGRFPNMTEFCSNLRGIPGLVADSVTCSLCDQFQPCTWVLFRVNNFPSIATWDTGTDDYVYVTWATYGCGPGIPNCYSPPQGTSDILFSRRLYPAQTAWDPASTINGDSNPGRDQFFPFITVDPLDGAIRVFYYDRRNDSDTDGPGGMDTENERISVYMAGSTNRGTPPWSYEREVRCRDVDDEGFRADDFIGDYIGAASQVGSSQAVWADREQGVGGPEEEIWSAIRGDP